MYPAEHGGLAVVAPLAAHPTNRNGVIVFDLRHDPRPFAALDAEGIRERLFTPACDLPPGVARMPLKTVHLNRSPALAPLPTLTPEAAARWGIDLDGSLQHLEYLRAAEPLHREIRIAHGMPAPRSSTDPDRALYDGFFADGDRARMARVRSTPPSRLGTTDFAFEDARLPELLFRYRARNFPDTLSDAERERWRSHCCRCLAGGLEAFRTCLAELRAANQGERATRILDALEAHARQLGREAGLPEASA
jgi:exodeoxyribonuclease-1